MTHRQQITVIYYLLGYRYSLHDVRARAYAMAQRLHIRDGELCTCTLDASHMARYKLACAMWQRAQRGIRTAAK